MGATLTSPSSGAEPLQRGRRVGFLGLLLAPLRPLRDPAAAVPDGTVECWSSAARTLAGNCTDASRNSDYVRASYCHRPGAAYQPNERSRAQSREVVRMRPRHCRRTHRRGRQPPRAARISPARSCTRALYGVPYRARAERRRGPRPRGAPRAAGRPAPNAQRHGSPARKPTSAGYPDRYHRDRRRPVPSRRRRGRAEAGVLGAGRLDRAAPRERRRIRASGSAARPRPH